MNIIDTLREAGIPSVDVHGGSDIKRAMVEGGHVKSNKEWERLKKQGALQYRVDDGVRVLFIGGLKKPFIINLIKA